MELTDRLAYIAERLHRRRITDITEKDVVNKLLSTRDACFESIIAEIKLRSDFEELHYLEALVQKKKKL